MSLTALNTRGIPARALVLNFVVGLAYLLPLPSWHSIISVTGSIAAFTFQIGAVSLIAFRASGLTRSDTRLRGMTAIAPVAFVVSSLVVFWTSWSKLSIAMAIIAVGIVWYAVVWLRSPWDSVVVAVFSLVTCLWGARSGTAYMKARPEMVRRLRAEADEDRGDLPEEEPAR
jgi:hypothetical protein